MIALDPVQQPPLFPAPSSEARTEDGGSLGRRPPASEIFLVSGKLTGKICGQIESGCRCFGFSSFTDLENADDKSN